MATKFSKEELATILHKPLLECNKDEIGFVFNIFNLKLKEYCTGKNTRLFEVHFKRAYIAKVSVDANMLEFSNEYVTFDPDSGAHGIAMGKPESLTELIVVFINMFTPNLLQSAGYNISYDPEHSPFESLEEAQSYLETVQSVAQEIIDAKHKEPVTPPKDFTRTN